MATAAPRLRVHYPPGTERVLLIEAATFNIGRRPDNDLVIAEKDISRLQAVIYREGTGYMIEDRGSTFGTFINGVPATRQRLRNRDVIALGRDQRIEVVFLIEDRMSEILETVESKKRADTTPDDYRNLSILLELSKGLDRLTSLQDMLELALDATIDVTKAERGFIMLRDDSGDLGMRAARNPERESLEEGQQRVSQSIVAEVVSTGEPQFLTDTEDPRLKRRTSVAELSLRTIVCLPLRILPSEQATRPTRFPDKSDVLGVIYADSSHASGPLKNVTRDLLTSIATHATFALQNFFLRQEDLERRLLERETEREMDRLRELDRLKTEFLSNVSHELRTPLTAIKGSIDNMLDGVTGEISDRQRGYLKRINENTEQLNRLIADLLDLARIESGEVPVRPRSMSVNRLIDEAAESMRPALERRGVHLKVEQPREDLVITADRDRLMQVLFNLIGNAVKFTGQGGTVTLDARHMGDEIVVSVSDTGVGIPEHDLERIFDRFYQSPVAAGTKSSGTGLGLPIARSLVELHGGRLWAENGEVGCRFHFTLPAIAPSSNREPRTEAE
ncbi:MAG TPA: ATP-binding protein [Patescibacteria group bacterium]|nr:ATP-binding protein [Patescibacteria group bacterium]